MTVSGLIAILVCDTPIEQVTEKFGDFGDNIIDMLVQVGWEKKQFKKYQVSFENNHDYIQELEKVYIELKNDLSIGLIKGVILSGSRSDSFAIDIPWINQLNDFIQNTLFHSSLPLVGLCFGHQILCKNLGCKVGRNLENGIECGTVTMELSPEINIIENSPFGSGEFIANTHYNIVEFHQDIVYGMPPPEILEKYKTSFQCIGSTPKCVIQGIITERGPLKIFTVQGHPEFSTELALVLLDYDLKKGLIDSHQYEKSVYNTKIMNNGGKDMAQVISNFLNCITN